LAVDFAQTILEIAPVMLLPGLHDNFERGVDRFSSLFKFRSIVRPLSTVQSTLPRLFCVAAHCSGTRARVHSYSAAR
jgi:hypothetical protein